MNKKKSFFEEYKYIIYAFLATTVTMIIIYACNRMVPFGDKTILRMDLYHQYGPLFAELYERVKQGASLTYSWVSGLGSCFLGNYFNYLSSPIGAIVLFFGHENVPEAIAVMILLKAALSSSTFTYYLKRSLKSQSYASIAFSVMYAFCGYMLAYYWNVMWLDAMVLLPIVLLGIERIINNGKCSTYIIGLALSMFSNYYMSYMLCLFSVVYFIYYYFTYNSLGAKVDPKSNIGGLKNSKFFRSGCQFAFASLAAAGLMAVVLLPVYGVLQTSSATSGTFPTETDTYFNFFDFFANHFASLTTTIRSSGDDVLPNIYCGVLTIILAPLFFFTKSISKKEKVTTLLLLGTLYITFNLNFANYIWHGLHFPNDLPYRQSFIYSFILLVIAYKTFLRLNEFKARHFGIVGAALIAYLVIVEELTSKNVTDATVLLSLALIVLYVLVLTVFKDKRYQTVSIAALLIVCVCSEAVMCDTNAVSISVDKTPYTSDLSDFEDIKGTIDTIEKDGFYRMELTDLRTRMDPSWYYYNGVSVFSSMANEKLSNLQDDLGLMSNRINSYTYNPQTPVYNMMFALKYLVNNESPNVLSSEYYSSVGKNDTFEAFKNKYNLPIAFMTSSDVKDWANEDYIDTWKFETGSDPFQLQGDWFKRATGLDNPFEKMEISYVTYNNIDPFTESLEANSFYYDKTTDDTDASTTLYVTTEKEGNVYIYFDISGSNSKNLTITSSLGTSTHPADQDCVLDLGRYAANETITINVPFDENVGTLKFYAYTMNDETFKKGYEILSENEFVTETHKDTYIKGKVVTKQDGLLYTSIPYDKGWKVTVDGETVETIKIGQSLLGVELQKGIHEIEFKYEATGVATGIAASALTAALLLILLLIKKLRERQGKKPILPQYPLIDNSYSEDVLYPEKIKVTVPVQTIKYIDVSSKAKPELPKREIISPAKEVKREVIAPPQKDETIE